MNATPPICPRCDVPLTAFEHEQLRANMCTACRGLFFERDPLYNAEASLLWLVKEAPLASDKALPCPLDRTPMEAKEIRLDLNTVVVDCCPRCDGLWLDRGELADLRKAVRRDARAMRSVLRQGPSAEKAKKQAQAVLDSQDRRLLTNSDDAVAKTGPGWTVFAILTDLPVEGYNPVYRSPVVTHALMLFCIGVFVVQVVTGGLLELALVPGNVWSKPFTLLTSVFLHGGIIHLLVNLYFLKICGDNVEDRLGRRWFLLLFLVAGLGGSLTHSLLTTTPDIPALGASGAVSGILAAYVWFFPDVRLSLLPFWWFIARAMLGSSTGQGWLHLRAMFYIPIWLVAQFLMLAIGVSGIGFWAHIGGFAFGLGLTAWMAKNVPDARIATLAERIARGEKVDSN